MGALAPFALTSGCQLYARGGPTDVAQGKYYSTGNPDYDEFFIELHRLQVELRDAPETVKAPRVALAERLDTGIDSDEIKTALTKKVGELAGRSVKLSVEKPADTTKPLALRVSGSPSGPDAELKATLDETLGKASELKQRIGGWLKLLDALPGKATALEGDVDEAFVGKSPGRREEVKHNLADGRKIIELLLTRAKDAEHSNDELLDTLTSALGTAEAEAPEENGSKNAKEPAEKKKGKKAPPPAPAPKPAKSKPAKAAASPPAPKPAKPAPAPPAPKPTPEPKPVPAPKPAAEKSDVPPPPKPTQGTAKPDFEP